jgi:Uma2 family endonuclease
MTTTILQKPSDNLTEKSYYTPEEYLAFEEKSEFKHEYRNGEIVLMTGGTTNHNKIAGNFYTELKIALKGQSYELFFADVRLWIPRYRQYTYPDVMLIEGEPIYEGKGTTTVTNPSIIMEVLSSSTQDYDRGTKFTYYRSIPQLKEYILINQYQYAIEQFTKNEQGKWVLSEAQGEDAILTLSSINLPISFTDIYETIKFETLESKSNSDF